MNIKKVITVNASDVSFAQQQQQLQQHDLQMQHRLEETSKPISLLRRALMQVAAGGSAGFIEVCIMQPLDVVKTRLQLQAGSSTAAAKTHYTGVFNCFATMYRQEGIFSYWKGILPPIIAETPKRAVKFLVFEQTKPIFQFNSAAPTPLTFSLAGLTAGLVEAIVVNPFEVIKVAQQADRSASGKSVNSMHVLRHIVQTQGYGLRGLNKGVTATMGRNGLFNMVYFGFYHSVRNRLPAYDDGNWEFGRKMLIGFTAGTLACFVNTPCDVAKSRIQGPQPNVQTIKYRYLMQTLWLVQREEGFRALYKGLVPKVMRLGPGGAILLLVFEHVYNYLQQNFA